MNFHSTRSAADLVKLPDAILAGLAPDGGLYVPDRFPQVDPSQFEAVPPWQVGARMLAPFFQGESLEPELADICREAISFPLPRVATSDPNLSILELFHGPTAAFKDVGARFLAACLERLHSDPVPTVMVATSGDTGSAVAAACAERSGLRVVILYPEGGVSPRQEHQLTCWGDNVLSLRIRGSFDDCQRMVKESFLDRDLQSQVPLTSANSISVARLLPQMIYYAATSLDYWRETGEKANFIVPTGNLGNALAGIWARRLGMPIDRFALATNANATISRFLDTGEWEPGKTIATLASAMDVSNPSNMERLRHLYPSFEEITGQAWAISVSDEQISEAIVEADRTLGQELCPHTATAYVAYKALRTENPDHDPDCHWIALATAHAAKFETIVEPLVGRPVEVPPALADILHRPTHRVDLPASTQALKQALLDWPR